MKGQTLPPRIFAQTQNDVWVHHKQIQDFKVGAVDLNLLTCSHQRDSPGSLGPWMGLQMHEPLSGDMVTFTAIANKNGQPQLVKKSTCGKPWKTKARHVMCRRMLIAPQKSTGTKMNQAQDTPDILRCHVGVGAAARITILYVRPMCFAAKEQSSAV